MYMYIYIYVCVYVYIYRSKYKFIGRPVGIVTSLEATGKNRISILGKNICYSLRGPKLLAATSTLILRVRI